MDIFYQDKINAGVLHVVSVPNLVGTATLKFIVPAPQNRTFVTQALITGVTYSQRTNTQFQQSLDNVIYVYSFGDQMGDLTLTGLAFARACDGRDNGVSNVQKFYREHRVSQRVSNLEVVFANEVIRGYLVGLSMNTVDPSSGLHQFNLLLKTIPAAFNKRSGLASDTTEHPTLATLQGAGAALTGNIEQETAEG